MAFHLVYGLVIGSVLAPFYIACIVLLFLKRNNKFLRARNPVFLLIQACGVVHLATVTTIYVGLRNDFNCSALNILEWFAFPFFVYPFLMRCWEYCANFHIANSRVNVDTSKFLGGKMSDDTSKSWFVKHRHLGNATYLVNFYLRTFWITLLPIIPVVVNAELDSSFQKYDYVYYGCYLYPGFTVVVAALTVLSVIAMVVLAVMLRKSRDAFHIRNEIIGVAATWGVIIVPALYYATMEAVPEMKMFPPTNTVVVAFHICCFINVVFPLYLAIKDERSHEGESSEKFDAFMTRLALPSFRNGFFQFLSLQFCAENILFYEVASEWKARNENKPIDDLERVAQAKTIYDSFIEESGEFQINITSDMKDKITDKFSMKEYPPDVFDLAMKEVVEMMYANSYHLFLKSKLFDSSSFRGSVNAGEV